MIGLGYVPVVGPYTYNMFHLIKHIFFFKILIKMNLVLYKMSFLRFAEGQHITFELHKHKTSVQIYWSEFVQ